MNFLKKAGLTASALLLATQLQAQAPQEFKIRPTATLCFETGYYGTPIKSITQVPEELRTVENALGFPDETVVIPTDVVKNLRLMSIYQPRIRAGVKMNLRGRRVDLGVQKKIPLLDKSIFRYLANKEVTDISINPYHNRSQNFYGQYLQDKAVDVYLEAQLFSNHRQELVLGLSREPFKHFIESGWKDFDANNFPSYHNREKHKIGKLVKHNLFVDWRIYEFKRKDDFNKNSCMGLRAGISEQSYKQDKQSASDYPQMNVTPNTFTWSVSFYNLWRF